MTVSYPLHSKLNRETNPSRVAMNWPLQIALLKALSKLLEKYTPR